MSSNAIQQASKKKVPGKKSEWFGVTWCKQHDKWVAKTTVNYQSKHIGLFDSDRDAAIAYIEDGIKRFGSNFRIEDQKKLGLIPGVVL